MSPGDALSLLHLLLILGLTTALSIFAKQPQVNGNEGDTIQLNTYYTLNQPISWLQIRWEYMSSTPVALTLCTIRSNNASHGEESKVIIKRFQPKDYEQRMYILHENGSLIIKHLRKTDSGIYKVTLRDSVNSASTTINVTVNNIALHAVARNIPESDESLEDKTTVLQENSIALGTENWRAIQDKVDRWTDSSTDEARVETTKMDSAAHCSCTTNSSTVDFPTSAWIILGSRIASALITFFVIFGIQVSKRKNKKCRRMKF